MAPFKEYSSEIDFENLKDAVDVVLIKKTGVLKRTYIDSDRGDGKEIVVYRTGRDGIEDQSSPVVLIGSENEAPTIDTPSGAIIEDVNIELMGQKFKKDPTSV